MLVVHDFADFRSQLQPQGRGRAAVTIGNFDGCHLGHQHLIKATVERAAKVNGPAVAVTFTPRPDAFFRGQTREVLLFSEAQKTRALREAGIDVQVFKTFDAAFSRVAHVEFYDRCLRQELTAAAVVVGENFHFGHGRGGDAAYLKTRGDADGIDVLTDVAATHAGSRISSTRIRAALATGDVAVVNAMLGRPYLLEGRIERGDQLGRQLGVPTANLERIDQLLPRFGVYAGFVWLADAPESAAVPPLLQRSPAAVPAVFALGVRPALGMSAPPVRVEAHLLTGSYGLDSLYGRRAGYYLTHHLREERNFPDLEALKRQMAADIVAARQLTGA